MRNSSDRSDDTQVGPVDLRGHLLAVPVDFRIALTRIRFSHHILIQMRTDDATGVGEGILYRTLPHQAGALFGSLVRPALAEGGMLNTGPEEQRAWLAELATASPALAYAVDTALWDLRGRADGRPVADLLGGTQRRHIPITEQIFIRDWATAEAELDAILSRGTRRLKVKIGVNPQADLEAVRCVRAFVGPEVEIRVDVNHAYTLAEGEPLYHTLADLGVLALEEPLRLQDWPNLRALRQRVGLPVILDESVLSLEDLRAAIAEEAIDILNIKLTRVGGISQALRYAEVCRQHGVQVAIGCTEDLGVGTAAIAHLAATLPQVHSTEGLGSIRLGFDLTAEPWNLQDGALAVPQGPGLGMTLPADWQDRLPHQVQFFDLDNGGWPLRTFSYYALWFQRASNVIWRIRRKVER
jgi:L-alanine-DL-glutamate epimerase-like enolase superfamily enzyme